MVTISGFVAVVVIVVLVAFVNDVFLGKTQEDITMAIQSGTQRQTLANAYAGAATYAGLSTSAHPLSSITGEVTGGTYVRKPLTWTPGANGVTTASATFDVPASTTVASSFLTTAVSAGTFLDSVAVSYASQTSAGTLTVNYTYTQS